MNNKTLKIILIILLGISVFMGQVLIQFGEYSKAVYWTKNISFIVSSSVLAILILRMIHKRMSNKTNETNKKNYYRIGFYVLSVLTVVLLSQVRLPTLELQGATKLTSCIYYDKYENRLFETALVNRCPIEEKIVYTDDMITMEFLEHYDGYILDNQFVSVSHNNKFVDGTVYIKSNITATYQNGNLTSYKLTQSRLLIWRIEEETKYGYTTDIIEVENTYVNNDFHSNRKVYRHSELLDTLDEETYPSHYDFEPDDYTHREFAKYTKTDSKEFVEVITEGDITTDEVLLKINNRTPGEGDNTISGGSLIYDEKEFNLSSNLSSLFKFDTKYIKEDNQYLLSYYSRDLFFRDKTSRYQTYNHQYDDNLSVADGPLLSNERHVLIETEYGIKVEVYLSSIYQTANTHYTNYFRWDEDKDLDFLDYDNVLKRIKTGESKLLEYHPIFED